jgi:putative transposase
MYRHYYTAKLAARKHKKVKLPASERMPLQIVHNINEMWRMDFISDSLADGWRIKCLTVAEDFRRECMSIATDYGIGGLYVTRSLDQVTLFRGHANAMRTDNESEFTSRAFMAWIQSHGIGHIPIQPGRRMPSAKFAAPHR